MDGTNWKRILLRWANLSGLIERTVCNIEQTDIDVFFERFRNRMTSTPIKQEKIILFLKEEYTDFEIHVDDDNILSSSDYMYVYSLLLHFSCVKCPEEFFHNACQKLSEQFQQVIAVFFKILLVKDVITKESIRHAIADASTNFSVQFISMESPVTTPRSKMSPLTPKTNMLEERTKELYWLKAQLDSERYEKGFLEVQLKQYEDKIEKLSQDQKKHLAEIHDLKNELLAISTENYSPNKNVQDEQIKKRLRKDIAEKEEIILNLRENLDQLKEEKTLVNEKLTYAEKQVVICLDKIKEMDYTMSDLKSEIEQKDSVIQTLTETKNELELFINETRSSHSGFRGDLNTTAECLDTSLSRTTNSSGSVSSPENLGCSVIDIKLREKENENRALLEQIEKLRYDSAKLSKHICELTVRYSDVFDICNENLIVSDDADLTESFIVFVNYLDKIVETYTITNKTLKNSKEENVTLQSDNIAMGSQIAQMEHQLLELKKTISDLDQIKNELDNKNSKHLQQNKENKKEIEMMKKEYADLSLTLDDLRNDYEQLQKERQTISEANIQLKNSNNELSDRLQHKLENISELEELNANHVKGILKFEDEIQRLKEVIEALKLEKKNQLQSVQSSLDELSENYEKQSEDVERLSKRIQDMENDIQCKLDNIEQLEEQLMISNQESKTLNDNLSEVNKLKCLVEERCEEIEMEVTKANEEFAAYRGQSDNLVQMLKDEKCEIENSLKKYESKIKTCEQRNDELQNLINDLTKEKAHVEVLLKEKETCLEELGKEMQELQCRSNKEMETLKETATSLEQQNENLENEVRSLITQLSNENEDNSNIEQGCPVKILKDKLNVFLISYNDLKTLNSEFQSSESDQQSEIVELQMTKDALDAKCKDLSDELVTSEEAIMKLSQQFNVLDKSLRNMTLEKEAADYKVKNLTQELEDILAQTVQLNDQISLLETSEKTLKEHVEYLQTAESNLKKKFVNLEELCTSLTEENNSLKIKYEENCKLVEKLKEKMDQIVQVNDDKIVAFEVESTTLKQQIDELNSLNGDLTEKLRNQLNTNNNLISKLDKAKDELQKTVLDAAASKEELNTVNESKRELEEQNNAQKLKIDELEDEISNTVLRYTSSLEQLTAEASDMSFVNMDLSDKLVALEEGIKALQVEKISLESEVEKLQHSVDEVTAKSVEKENDYANLKLQYAATCSEKEEILESNTKLKENAAKLNSRLEMISIKLGETQSDFYKLEKANAQIKSENDELQKSVSHNKTSTENLQKHLQNIQSELKNALSKAAQLQELYETEVEKNKVLEKTNEESSEKMRELLKEAADRCGMLEKEYTMLREKTDVLSNADVKLSEVLEKNERLEREIGDLREKSETLEHTTTKLNEIALRKDQLEEENKTLLLKSEQLALTNTKVEEMTILKGQLETENNLLLEKINHLSSLQSKIKEAKDMVEELKRDNEILRERVNELNSSEENLKETTSHIDNIKHELELKVEKLSTTLKSMGSTLEATRIENSELRKINTTLDSNLENLYKLCHAVQIKQEETEAKVSEDFDRYKEVVERVSRIQDENQNLQEDNMRLLTDLENTQEENSKLIDNISKLSLKLQILQEENNTLSSEVTTLRTSFHTLRIEKDNLEKENLNTLASLKELECRQDEMINAHEITEKFLNHRAEEFKIELDHKQSLLDSLDNEIKEYKCNDSKKVEELLYKTKKINEFQRKFENIEEMYRNEKELNEKLKKDIAIFQAKLYKNRQLTEENERKWLEEKNKLIAENKIAEERIKDNRLELEGKLEKMKNKMKSLYNEEVSKIKHKHEREMFELKKEVKDLISKNDKYEHHVQKLAKQIFNLNENILELQKQNKFMETKLKDLESFPSTTFRRTSNFPSSQVLSSNLRMEDEEGEIFNNTYLADLQSGRMSPFGRDSVSVQELHYRNSLAPPHLRSTYTAQYADQYIREEDIKDIVPINLDDSLSSLLHTGQRKKMSGTTSYKKPGPPTPSKNGGRLSFGGSDMHPREILKETNEASSCNSKKSTPAKFKNIFSSSKARDENTPPRRRLSNLFKSKK